MLVPTFPTRGLDEDAAHGLGCGPKKMGPTLELLVSDQPQKRLVDQCGWLERLTRCFLSQLLGREYSQFVVDQGQQLLRGARVAVFDRRHDARNIRHANEDTRPCGAPQGIGRGMLKQAYCLSGDCMIFGSGSVCGPYWSGSPSRRSAAT